MISTLNWNPIPDVIFPGRKSVIYDSGRIIWVFTQIEIKFYIYNSNNCSIFVWKGKSSWNIFLFVINNFRIIFHWLSIISTIYILFIYCRHCFRLYNRFSVSYFPKEKKNQAKTRFTRTKNSIVLISNEEVLNVLLFRLQNDCQSSDCLLCCISTQSPISSSSFSRKSWVNRLLHDFLMAACPPN